MNAEQAKLINIVDMAFGFSAMTMVFEKGSTEKIINKLNEILSQITSTNNYMGFKKLHDDFCHWFQDNIKTAERKRNGVVIKKSGYASYGQGGKVLDVTLKVYVYYCHLPDIKTADQIVKWLNAAVDTKMMNYLKKAAGSEASLIEATSVEDVGAQMYAYLQRLVRKDIEDNFQNSILPVQWDDIMWRRLNKKGKTDLKFKFKVHPFGVNSSAIDITCYDKSCRSHFPLPGKPFKLVIDDIVYTTSIRNLKNGWTQIAKTYEPSGIRISRADLCNRHSLHTGQTICIEVVTPQKVYRLT